MTQIEQRDAGDSWRSASARIDEVMSHAWMVRTFVKHCDEVNDFPELMQAARTIFDVARALETAAENPADKVKMLRKKIGRLRRAADQFRHDAPLASDHMNFRQAVASFDGCVRALDQILASLPQAHAPIGTARDDEGPTAG